MWHKITVEQYQQIYQVYKEPIEEIDKIIHIISILYNKSEHEVNNLPVTTFHKLTAEINQTFSPELKTTIAYKYIKANGHRYKLSYEVGNLRFGQWAELQHFLKGNLIENLHKLAASIAAPMRFGIIAGKNDSEQHEKVANDFLQANFLKTYSSVVFFCHKWTGSKIDTKDYLEKKMEKTWEEMTIQEKEEQMHQMFLMTGMAGYSLPLR